MKIPSGIKKAVAGATFIIQTKDRGTGQCVMIEGGLILTAAHCIDWDCKGGMAMGDFCLSKISTGGDDLLVSTRAIEPVSDIAVLGCPDGQAMPDKAAAFDRWCERIAPATLQRRIPKEFTPFPVGIWTHDKTWVSGMATYHDGCTFTYETREEIHSGTSGGPIVNSSGELVGIVSHGMTEAVEGHYISCAPLLTLALPTWVWRQIRQPSF